jgi:hypothetical protein
LAERNAVETRERLAEWNRRKMEGDRWAPAKVKMVLLYSLSAKNNWFIRYGVLETKP